MINIGVCNDGNYESANSQIRCSTGTSTVYTISEQTSDIEAIVAQYLIDNPQGSSVTNSQLTYEDFTLLGGAILSMFLVAYGLKQIRLIFNNR